MVDARPRMRAVPFLVLHTDRGRHARGTKEAHGGAALISRIVRVGKSKADAEEWPNEAKEEFGKLLRAMHPVNMIRRRLRYYLGQGGKALSGRLRAMSSDSMLLHRNASARSNV